MIGAVITGIVVFTVGIFILWLLVYASGLVQPRVRTEPELTGVEAMERKVLLATGMILATGALLTIYGFVDPMRQAAATERQLETSIKRGAENYATLCMSCHGTDGKGAVVPGTDPPRVGPQLNREQFANAWQGDPDELKKTYDLVYKTIQRGRPGTPMPAWGQTDGGTLNQEQILELAQMIVHGSKHLQVAHGETSWELAKEIADEAIAHGAPTPIPPEAALLAGAPPEVREGIEIFSRNGCQACHAVQGDTRLLGPSLANISQNGAQRKPGMSAEDYIRESVRQPSAFITPGFPGPPSPMPPFSPAQIPDDDLNKLIQYLLILK
jgi:mono/diheme cytochrome c family protein